MYVFLFYVDLHTHNAEQMPQTNENQTFAHVRKGYAKDPQAVAWFVRLVLKELSTDLDKATGIDFNDALNAIVK